MIRSKAVSLKETILVASVTALVSFFSFSIRADLEPDWGFSVQLSAIVQASPPQIAIQWESDEFGAVSYTVYRKSKTSNSWGSPIATLPGSALNYADTTVVVGSTYEYQVIEQRSAQGVNALAYGYIYSGINASLIDNRGTIVLLVATNSTASLGAELAQLESDLIGDGWQVMRHDVSSNDTPAYCRSLVISEYNANPGSVNAVFLFGHVPILQSGMVNYDGHGARPMPADGYYGDMDGDWSSSPSFLPSDLELMVGRVDLADMPGAAAANSWPSETELLRNYLNKDHKWRFKQINVPRRALVADRFGTFEGETRASSGYRNFEPFVGPGNTQLADVSDTASPDQRWISLLTTGSYLWTYGGGGGQDTSISELGLHGQYNDVWSTDIRAQDARAVFFMLEGSHFGNWDHSDNVMRAVLATPTMGLAVCCIAGRPQWYCHHVGLGEPIGYGARLSMNNSTLYRDTTNEFARAVYVALMGDPALRIDQVAPVSNLGASANDGVVHLNWLPSTDSVAGYHVYRGTWPRGPFTRLTSNLLSDTSFEDATAPMGTNTYLVRAVALQSNPSGSYLNPSQGVFITANVSQSGDTNGSPDSFVINPGTYNGLFFENDQVRANSAGAFSVTLNAKGSYSGRLLLQNHHYSFGGKLSATGQGTNSLSRGHQTPLLLNLSFGTGDETNQVFGTLNDGASVANLTGDKAQFNSRSNPCAWAGNYTLIIPGSADNPSLPAGDSLATVRVSSSGQATASIALADNTKVTQSATISAGGSWPLYAAVGGGQGSIIGWLTLADRTSDDVSGVLNWMKSANAHSRYFPGGFGFETGATGSRYEAPSRGGQPINATTATLTFSGGNLASDISIPIAITATKGVSDSNTSLKMTFSPSNGRFSGSVKDPSTSKSLPFSGVILQKSNSGAGFLLGTNQTSRVELGP